MGRLYQLFGFFCVLCVYWYVWKQCAGLKFRRAVPLALLITFIFITIHFKHISNPLLAYAAIGVIGIPAITYGLLYHYEILLLIAAIYIPHNAILPADFGGIQKALNGTNIVLLALIVGVLQGKARGGRSYQQNKLANNLVIIFMITILIAFIRGALFHGSAYLMGMIFDFKRFITPMILYLLFVFAIKDRDIIKTIVSVLYIVVIMAIFLGLLEWVDLGFGTYSTFERRIGSLNLQANSFGAFIAFYSCLFLAQFMVNFRSNLAKYLIFPFILALRVLIPVNSRGAWIAFPPAFFTVTFFKSKLLFIAAAFILIVPVLINPALLPETIRYRFEGAVKLQKSEELYHASGGVMQYAGESRSISIRTRAQLFEGGIKLWQRNIFFGHGYGVFPYVVGDYTATGVRGGAHNFFLQMLCEMGVITFLSLSVLLVTFFKTAVYVYKREKDLFLKGFALGYLGIIPALLVANLTGNRFSHVDLLAIFWILSACIIRLKAIQQTEAIFLNEVYQR